MIGMDILTILSIVLVGLLAGEEVAVRWAVHPALVALDDATQLRARQALIRTLRVLVPVIYFAGLAATIADLVVGGPGGLRLAAVVALVVWAGATFGGTVIINSAVIAWDPDAPPANWRGLVVRWARIDVVRSSAAVVALVLVAVAAVL